MAIPIISGFALKQHSLHHRLIPQISPLSISRSNSPISNIMKTNLNAGKFILPPAICFMGPLILRSVGNFIPSTAILSYSPLLAAYIPVLLWGVSWSRIGSWKSMRSNIHRFGGVLTLLVPMTFAIFEAITSQHVHPVLYGSCIFLIMSNIVAGASLIPRKIPAYDIPTLRAFAVGTLLAAAFVSQSLFFRFGSLSGFEPVGKCLALVSLYAVIYAWSDALQHLMKYMSGDYKLDVGKKWYLPFTRSSYRHIFIDCLYKQPTKESLDATVSPANFVTVCTTFLTAVFASISLLQMRYLVSGSAGVQAMLMYHPELVRWSCYEALLAVVANNFGTFAGTLVIQNKVSQKTAGIFNALGLFIPVLNFLAFVCRNPMLAPGLLRTSFGNLHAIISV